MRLRLALLATVACVAALVGVAVAASPASACEFPTYQYTFTGVDGTWRSEPGGPAQGTWYGGDLFNTGEDPSQGPWLIGNVYTGGGVYKGSGWVLRDYLHYLRSWC